MSAILRNYAHKLYIAYTFLTGTTDFSVCIERNGHICTLAAKKVAAACLALKRHFGPLPANWPDSDALNYQSLYSAFPVFNSRPESLKVEGGREKDAVVFQLTVQLSNTEQIYTIY